VLALAGAALVAVPAELVLLMLEVLAMAECPCVGIY
jgi:hypothetical protein